MIKNLKVPPKTTCIFSMKLGAFCEENIKKYVQLLMYSCIDRVKIEQIFHT